ncbi:MAG: hypothetical protein VX408_06285 [Pseudomonadota bacterium]|nr:hypothetical protein [Pseudomonadota bacterium]MED6317135.1 hypothetical protein [Pseudomonadota bacterium]
MFALVILNASQVVFLLLSLVLICLIWVTVKTSGKRKAQLKKLLEEAEEELDDSPFDFTQAGVRQGGFFAERSDSSDSSDGGGD